MAILDGQALDDVRREVGRGNNEAVFDFTPTEVTLDGAFELACWVKSNPPSQELKKHLWEWCKLHPVAKRAVYALMQPTKPDDATPTCEIRPAPSAEEIADLGSPWHAYTQRFRAALVNHGRFGGQYADGLVGVFAEMADNIVQHSGSEGAPADGIVGFLVEPSRMRVGVADLGRGVLESLRSNPLHRGLRTTQEALSASVVNHKTRRLDRKEGNGFKEVFSNLAALSGYLRFRCEDAVLTIEGQVNRNRAQVGTSLRMKGFQIFIECSP